MPSVAGSEQHHDVLLLLEGLSFLEIYLLHVKLNHITLCINCNCFIRCVIVMKTFTPTRVHDTLTFTGIKKHFFKIFEKFQTNCFGILTLKKWYYMHSDMCNRLKSAITLYTDPFRDGYSYTHL